MKLNEQLKFDFWEIFKELEQFDNGYIQRNEIIYKASKMNISMLNITQAIWFYLKSGDIFEPKSNLYKRVIEK